VQLLSKIFNLCGHDPPTSQTGERTTCDSNTALCTVVHRAEKKPWVRPVCRRTPLFHVTILATLCIKGLTSYDSDNNNKSQSNLGKAASPDLHSPYIRYTAASRFLQKFAHYRGGSGPPFNTHGFLDPSDTSPEPASRSNQPFFQNSRSLPADRQTDRQT